MDNMVEDNVVLTIGRAKMYSAIFTALYSIYHGKSVPEESVRALKYLSPRIEDWINEIKDERLEELRGSYAFEGLKGHTYQKIMEEFYQTYGFEAKELPPDHVITLIAFMSRLIMEELQSIQRNERERALHFRVIQHRLISTHLLELLGSFEKMKPLLDLVKMDRYILFSALRDEISKSP